MTISKRTGLKRALEEYIKKGRHAMRASLTLPKKIPTSSAVLFYL